jgi:AsmA protein
VSSGKLKLDDSQATFSAQARDFNKPDLKFDLNLDRIDLDRYLPPPTEEDVSAETAKQPPADSAGQKTDYGPLRRLILDARIKTGELKVKNARIQNIEVRISARNGSSGWIRSSWTFTRAI